MPTAWKLVTDIGLPARCSPELQSVEWLGDADGVAMGARFRGTNHIDAMGTWQTECEIVEVDDERRWVWNVLGGDGIVSTWAFEVEPTSDGVLIRQWARVGTGSSGLSAAIAARPDAEARIIAARLTQWQKNMQLNLDCIRDQFSQ